MSDVNELISLKEYEDGKQLGSSNQQYEDEQQYLDYSRLRLLDRILDDLLNK